MSHKPSLLARLFRRSEPTPLVSALFANAIGQPLLVHPQMGEQILGGYLHGAIEARPPTSAKVEIAPERRDEMSNVITPGRAVGLLQISGGLVNRFEGDWCDPGPLSYQELRSAFDRMLADDAVEAIVLRIESPGGMASGVFDFADHVYAARGTKPIYAMLDDYAYSAAYAIAAAADEVWITRTGGAGSVGAIAYHYDQSGWDAKVGLKVTTIAAGKHKADMNPHAPLPESVQSWLQARLDSLRALFAQSVATYRGMELQAVLDTEAQVYQGQDAIDIGFADRLGTYHELIAHIAAGGDDGDDGEEEQGTSAPADDTKPAATTTAEVTGVDAQADGLHAGPATTVELSAPPAAETINLETLAKEANLPKPVLLALLAREAFDENATDAQLQAEVAYARKVVDLCAAAKLPEVAVSYVIQSTPVETVRAQLAAAVADPGPELVTTHPANPAANQKAASPLSPSTIYQKRKPQ